MTLEMNLVKTVPSATFIKQHSLSLRSPLTLFSHT